ncbi:pentatricopeptide repeat-containing protein At4g18975, chloroplastic isoform X2 [Sorghum bicolor]|uniref:pentatricopeptide repeat-containing protein At4g18975, chloroplastic isoform X2 n=1 Tax=Sorghum bicolor TaxID=4558 RepID=UPI000B424F97|nr:pentatricopeptide repeat-containing protein At4g18975, chloroplastic isoform X2 [Sorghum bicolor]|eukprot:XP_021307992.1 pentatricopeptide repeat-containing protein At4g18975, chloroplastic isoform X2 [Sorghum bicolor]
MAGAFALRLVPRLAAEPPGRGKGGGGGASRDAGSRALVSKKPNKQQHLWIRKETAGSGKKALRLIDAVSKLPNEREAIYGALDKWSAFEPEFPIIAAAKALGMLKRRQKWLRIIQVTKWLMSKGQVLTWTTLICAQCPRGCSLG